MTFLSPVWLFWMWITVSLYWLSPRELRLHVLAAISTIFLASVSPVSLAILVAFCGLCYTVTAKARVEAMPVAGAILTIAGVLIFYKLGLRINASAPMETIVIPLGLSFFSFRCIHFILERYKGHVGPTRFREIVGYLFFLPTFVVGPIHRFDDYRRDERRQRFDMRLVWEGAERIVQGYAKIVILSNYLVEEAFGTWIDGLASQNGPGVLYLRIVQNGLNLYLQFSGHSDIAIGFAMLLGFRVMENFNWPYLQSNISDFWRSWHISLSRWSRDYVYASVVAMTRSPALGALATMAVIGLWHEVSLRFLLWGAYHGAGLIVWQQWQSIKAKAGWQVSPRWSRLLHVASIVATVHFVWFGFVILSAAGPMEALRTYRMFFLGWLG